MRRAAIPPVRNGHRGMPPPEIPKDMRSVSASSTSTAVSARGLQLKSAHPRSPSKHSPSKDRGTNIKVVVRCRGPTAGEITAKSPLVVTTDRLRGGDICVMNKALLGGNMFNDTESVPSRNYQFDHVFGPDADQSVIYQDVVVPMMNDMFDGYNCTIFAYGATGTGKTYTMQGELDTQPSGAIAADAGVMPRVITRLFQRLEKDHSDYSVLISYLELYNEELRDLLAKTGAGENKTTSLKVYDDPSKKGTVVLGLLERQAYDAKSAINILREGSQRRQIAATRMNDYSSRSHAIFTISVISSASSNKTSGELFQIGKLNLVDLAGSENITRSGAEDMRAKEAGLINQSLLSLGRVITKLVARAARSGEHIPYRESILTRILQDSLGGHTKTCIIATVSPSRASVEETISTLEYALQARSIKNNPELNRRVAKHTLLKEMATEIDKLRADLAATRNQNGRYFDEDRWAEIDLEQVTMRREHTESRRAREVMEAQLLTVREEYDHNLLLLTRKDMELKEARERLACTTSKLSETQAILTTVEENLAEETIVREAHEQSEANLNIVAAGLRAVAKQGVSDVEGLFGKLDRKSTVLASNVQQVLDHHSQLSDVARLLRREVEQHHREQHNVLQNMQFRADQYAADQSKALENDRELLNLHINALYAHVDRITLQENASAELMTALTQMIQETGASLRDSFRIWKSTVSRNTEHFLKGLCNEWTAELDAAGTSVESLSVLIEGMITNFKTSTELERNAVLLLQGLADNISTTEIRRLQHQNDVLAKLLESEKAASDGLKHDLVSQVSTLLHNYTNSRNTHFQDAAVRLSMDMVDGQHSIEKFRLNHGSAVDGLLAQNKDLQSSLTKQLNDTRRAHDTATGALDRLAGKISEGSTGILDHVAEAASAHLADVEMGTGMLDTASGSVFGRLDASRADRLHEIDSLRSDSDLANQTLQSSIHTKSVNINQLVLDISSKGAVLEESEEMFLTQATKNIGELDKAMFSLSRHATVNDAAIGSTPKKRKWEYDDHWHVVQSREAALKQWQARNRTLPTNTPPQATSVVTSAAISITAEPVDPDTKRLNAAENEVTLRAEPEPRRTNSLADALGKEMIEIADPVSRRTTTGAKTNAPAVGHMRLRPSKRLTSDIIPPNQARGLSERSNIGPRRREHQ